MDAQERVRERLQRAMEGLLREFEADGTQPVDCEFMVTIYGGIVGISTAMMNSKLEVLTHENFPVDADSSGNGVPDDVAHVTNNPDPAGKDGTVMIDDPAAIAALSAPVARRRKGAQS